jgi:hypothetical protein
VQATELGEVIADLVDLLLALLGLDFLGRQRRQFRDRSTSRAKQTASNQKLPTPTHVHSPANSRTLHQPTFWFKLKLYAGDRDRFGYRPFS